MTDDKAPDSKISFQYVWTTKVTKRPVNDDEAVILLVSPKFATVFEHVSFQWSLKINGTTGSALCDGDSDEEGETPIGYVAVELYFVDGPISQVEVSAVVGVVPKDSNDNSITTIVEEKKLVRVQRGHGCEITDARRAQISQHLMENVEKVVKISVVVSIAEKLFDPYTYLDAVSPTPNKSFLTLNYNARVNSKIWRKRSKNCRKSVKETKRMSTVEQTDYEKKFELVMASENDKVQEAKTIRRDPASRRTSVLSLMESQPQPRDHEHLFKKVLIACCDSCCRRASSFSLDGRSAPEDSDNDAEGDESDDDGEQRGFECTESGKEHVHDMLANMYFNKIVLPEMEFVEDFVDFLIDAELNDLPVLKRACERYLCGELNSKKQLLTSLLLDMLFMSIVFSLPVMKSMTLSELSRRADEFNNPELLLEKDEYKNLDKRIRSLSDRNLIEVLEQCQAFRDQRNRVKIISS